jgi:hypothetical protein
MRPPSHRVLALVVAGIVFIALCFAEHDSLARVAEIAARRMLADGPSEAGYLAAEGTDGQSKSGTDSCDAVPGVVRDALSKDSIETTAAKKKGVLKAADDGDAATPQLLKKHWGALDSAGSHADNDQAQTIVDHADGVPTCTLGRECIEGTPAWSKDKHNKAARQLVQAVTTGMSTWWQKVQQKARDMEKDHLGPASAAAGDAAIDLAMRRLLNKQRDVLDSDTDTATTNADLDDADNSSSVAVPDVVLQLPPAALETPVSLQERQRRVAAMWSKAHANAAAWSSKMQASVAATRATWPFKKARAAQVALQQGETQLTQWNEEPAMWCSDNRQPESQRSGWLWGFLLLVVAGVLLISLWRRRAQQQAKSRVELFKMTVRCPISMEVMVDPVVLVESGQTYDRAEIEKWLRVHDTDPVTNDILKTKKTVPNFSLRHTIEALSIVVADIQGCAGGELG